MGWGSHLCQPKFWNGRVTTQYSGMGGLPTNILEWEGYHPIFWNGRITTQNSGMGGLPPNILEWEGYHPKFWNGRVTTQYSGMGRLPPKILEWDGYHPNYILETGDFINIRKYLASLLMATSQNHSGLELEI